MKQFCKELAKLMRKHEVSSIGVNIDGDTHGIITNFVVTKDRQDTVISEYNDYVTPKDLEEFH